MSPQTLVKCEESESPGGGNPWLYPESGGSNRPAGSDPATLPFTHQGDGWDCKTTIKPEFEDGDPEADFLDKIKDIISEGWPRSVEGALRLGAKLARWVREKSRDWQEGQSRHNAIKDLRLMFQNADIEASDFRGGEWQGAPPGVSDGSADVQPESLLEQTNNKLHNYTAAFDVVSENLD